MSESDSVGPQRRSRRERPSPYTVPEHKEKKDAEHSEPPPQVQSVAESSAEQSEVKPEGEKSKAQIVSDRYLLLENLEGSTLRRAIDLVTKKEYACRVVSRQVGAAILEAHFRLEFSEYVGQPIEIITAGTEQFIFFQKNFGDVHGLVRDRLVRDEAHAESVLRQIVSAVFDCHSAGVILTDMKMRRFVFANAERTKIVLETLEEATLLSSDDDFQAYRRVGHPAYLAPEAICCTRGSAYGGRQADIWGLGVIIYTVLTGRYPFNDQNPLVLFSKILQGHFYMPETMSTHARCLIRNLLRKNPFERLSPEDILAHPWFTSRNDESDERSESGDDGEVSADHTVPDTWQED